MVIRSNSKSLWSRSKRFLSRLGRSPAAAASATSHRGHSSSSNKNDDDDKTESGSVYYDDRDDNSGYDYQNFTMGQLVQELVRAANDSDAAIAEAVLYELSKRAGDDSSKTTAQAQRVAAWKHGVLPVVVHIMKTHRANANLQGAACLTLWNVMGPSDQETAIIQACGGAAGAAGVIDAIVAAMKTHADASSAFVATRACGAICNLVYRSVPNGVHLVDTLAVVPLIVAAMHKFTTDVAMQKYGCWALYNLTAFELKYNFDCKIMEAGGPQVLIEAMELHKKQHYTDENDNKDRNDLLKYAPLVLGRLADSEKELSAMKASK